MFGRDKVATLVAEFLGTGLLTLVILSVQRSTIGVPFFVALAAALATATLMVALGRVTATYFNPAVTLAMWTVRRVATLRAVVLIIVQLLGAWLAMYLYQYLTNQDLRDIGGDFSSRVLVAEAVGGVVLGMGWATVAYHVFSNQAKAAVVAAAYMLGIILASSAAIGLVNPAVALGTRSWEWGTYILGPVLGVVIGANLYGLLFAPRTAVARVAATSSASKTSTRTTSKRTTKAKSSRKK
jgi:glycerol uptake facilitator-like aquaporin